MSAREEKWHVKEADSDHCREDGEQWPCLAFRLMARIAELEAERHSTNEALSDAVEELRRRAWKRQTEDPHTSPLHHDYAVPHDLPPYESNVRGDHW